MTEHWDWPKIAVWGGGISLCIAIWILAVIGAVCLWVNHG